MIPRYRVSHLLADLHRHEPTQLYVYNGDRCTEVTTDALLYALNHKNQWNESGLVLTVPRPGIGILTPNPHRHRWHGRQV